MKKAKKTNSKRSWEVISNVLDIPLIVLLHGGGEVEMLQRNEDGTKMQME